jgi:hypothetical protein
VRRNLPERWQVKHQRFGQLESVAELRAEPIAELDGAKRVEPRLHQRRVS